MGFGIHKSVNLGDGVRLNISSHGLGVSAGVPGARVSVGPRGVEVNAGVGPVRYRQHLGGGDDGEPEPTYEAKGLLEAGCKAPVEDDSIDGATDPGDASYAAPNRDASAYTAADYRLPDTSESAPAPPPPLTWGMRLWCDAIAGCSLWFLFVIGFPLVFMLICAPLVLFGFQLTDTTVPCVLTFLVMAVVMYFAWVFLVNVLFGEYLPRTPVPATSPRPSPSVVPASAASVNSAPAGMADTLANLQNATPHQWRELGDAMNAEGNANSARYAWQQALDGYSAQFHGGGQLAASEWVDVAELQLVAGKASKAAAAVQRARRADPNVVLSSALATLLTDSTG